MGRSAALAQSRKLLGEPGLVRSWGLTGSEGAVPTGLFPSAHDPLQTFPALPYGAPHRIVVPPWLFGSSLVPREAVEQLHGPTAIALAAFRPVDLETYDENAESPNYCSGRSPRSYPEAVEALLPPRKSWSPDALMFGDEEGDGIELWDDGVRVRLDMRQFNEPFARAIVSLAAANDLKLVMARTG